MSERDRGGGRRRSRVERLAEEYAGWCSQWESVLERRPGSNDQVQRAQASVSANIGEAFDSEALGEKRRYFGYALGSAGEGIRLLRSLGRIHALPDHALNEGLRLLRDIKWDLIRLIRWTRR